VRRAAGGRHDGRQRNDRALALGAILGAGCIGAVAVAGTAPAVADSVDGRVNPASAIRLSLRGELTFGALGKTAAKSFEVTEHGYTRTFNASSTNCGRGDRAITRFSPDAHAGPTATFTVTPLNPGFCSITVSDDGSGSVRVPVVVSAPAAAPSSAP
jgi:hypothetical protein